MSIIDINNVTIKFKDKIIFKNFSYMFNESKIYCIVGKSGSGKSTLLRAIAGLQKVNEGFILYDDDKIVKPNSDIAMMHQKYTNFPWLNCLNNILFPISCKRKALPQDVLKAEEILKTLELLESKNKFPYQLSGGMNQRLSLGRLIMQNPKIILMDEPLGALDNKTREELQNFIINYNEKYKNIIIMVTHDLDEANKLSNEIIRIGEG